MNASEVLRNDLRTSIQKFVDHRDKHGGIMLPTSLMIDDTYNDVMIELGQRPKPPEPKKIHIFGQNNQ
jgi:hypothetical protein